MSNQITFLKTKIKHLIKEQGEEEETGLNLKIEMKMAHLLTKLAKIEEKIKYLLRQR
jgi:hypothetical protein